MISAPSGVGKSTLIRLLMESVPDLCFSVSHTTRARRAGEQEGRDYFFVSRQRFEKMSASGQFLEWTNVLGNLYGTSRRHLEQARRGGRDVILDIDVQGQKQIRQSLPDVITVFILPPSFRMLKSRLLNRSSESKQVIRLRLSEARREIARWKEYDYLVVNDDLDRASQQLRAIVLAARARRDCLGRAAEKILKSFGGS